MKRNWDEEELAIFFEDYVRYFLRTGSLCKDGMIILGRSDYHEKIRFTKDRTQVEDSVRKD